MHSIYIRSVSLRKFKSKFIISISSNKPPYVSRAYIEKKFVPAFDNVIHLYFMNGLQEYAKKYVVLFLDPLYLFYDANRQAILLG